MCIYINFAEKASIQSIRYKFISGLYDLLQMRFKKLVLMI